MRSRCTGTCLPAVILLLITGLCSASVWAVAETDDSLKQIKQAYEELLEERAEQVKRKEQQWATYKSVRQQVLESHPELSPLWRELQQLDEKRQAVMNADEDYRYLKEEFGAEQRNLKSSRRQLDDLDSQTATSAVEQIRFERRRKQLKAEQRLHRANFASVQSVYLEKLNRLIIGNPELEELNRNYKKNMRTLTQRMQTVPEVADARRTYYRACRKLEQYEKQLRELEKKMADAAFKKSQEGEK